jgi:hypothetical protein
MSDERDAVRTREGVRDARPIRAHIASREDADAARADKKTDDDKHDAEQDLSSERSDDARDDQNHGDNPQQSRHRTSQVQGSPR